MAYPPVPLVTAFYGHCARLRSPRHFCQSDLLALPANGCTTSLAAAQGESTTVSVGSARVADWDVDGGGSGAALLLMLHDVATLPWAAGLRLNLTLHGAPTCAHDRMARRELPVAAAIKRNRGGASRPSSASPAITRVGGGVSTQSRTTSVVPAEASLAKSGAEGEEQGSVATSWRTTTAAGHQADRDAWQPFSEYSEPQACAETSALALRSFAVAQLGQRVPLVALVAERGCDAKSTVSALTEDCVTHRTSAVYNEQCSNSPAWLPPRTAVHRMPVEVYAERTPLLRTSGTAALQRALRQALSRVSTASAGHNSHGAAHLPATWRSSPSKPCGGLRWPVSPLAHLVWNGECWIEETDVQVVEMEERLLGALLGDDDEDAADASADVARSTTNRNTVMCGTPATRSSTREKSGAGRLEALRIGFNAQGPAYPRFWLPSCWRRASGLREVLTPLFRDPDDSSAGIGAVCGRPAGAAAPAASRCAFSSRSYEAWEHTSENGRVAEAAVEAAAGVAPIPAALRCSQWVLRLRKAWLVASPNVKSASLTRAGAEARADVAAQPGLGNAGVKPLPSLLDAARCASDHSHAPSSGSPAPVPVRYPNYDLLTGLPLNLRDYDAAARRARGASRGSRASSCSSSASKSAKLSLWPSWTTQTPPAHECCVQAAQAATFQYADDPFFLAALSQKVGWIRLSPTCNPHTPHVGASSASVPTATPGTGPVSWQLPDVLRRCYKIPSSIADVPQRWLCSGAKTAAQTAAPSMAAASSTAPAHHLPSLPPPPVASVSVPQQEWWTGFFLHDAPHWWHREVYKGAQQRWATKSTCKGRLAAPVRPRHERDAERTATAEEVARILSFLQEECRVPPPPVSAASTAAAVASPCHDAPGLTSEPSSPVEMTQKTATLPPHVCVLRLAPVAPVLRRPRRLLRRGEQGKQEHHCASTSATEALSLKLQWSLVSDTAAVTVNTFFSLQDVLNDAGPSGTASCALPPTSSAGRAVLFYVEVKAGLEVLRRAAHAAAAREDSSDDAEGPSPAPSSSTAWWEQLSAFYDANTFVGYETAPPATLSTTDEGNKGISSGGCEEVGTTHRDGVAHESAVPAFCHPAVTEVVRTCAQLMLRCGGPSHNCHVSDSPITLDSGGGEGNRVSAEAVAVWSRVDYDALLRTAVVASARAAATPSSVACLRIKVADGDGGRSGADEEANEEWAEERAPDQADEAAAHADNGSESSHAESAVTHETQRTRPASGAAAPSSRDHATSVGQDSPSSAQVAQGSSSTSSCLAYGVEVYKYDEEGTRSAPCLSCGGLDVSLNDAQTPATEPADWSGVDGRVPLERNGRLSEALQPHRNPDSFGTMAGAGSASSSSSSVDTCATSSAASLSSAGLPSAYLSSGKSAQAVTLGEASVASILDARKESRQSGGDVGADDGSRAQRQLRSAELLVQNKEFLYVGSSKDSTGSASPMPSGTDGGSPSPPLDVMGTLIAEERHRFKMEWQPWLRYLPPTTTQQRNTPSTISEPTETPKNVSRVFGFLQSSAASEYCTGSSSRADTTSSRGNGGERNADDSAPPAAAAASDGAVAVLDLGLCVLHVCRTEVYVNAANLLCHRETH
ncbi:hypothetical protein LMJF_18_0710 [Leishmania major strain Friedlin]|uniref:Uncharacterized protein n=1 Tax=Leishmania major TaxID=5664 RepID=Q4QDX1_LEIMA|nr:hypothetical protein LMJF_18_0710 [Leishmania major strain Friedlin]CAG9572456.1 hypothetical_protein_-_conserved [Leishmania major strain Friedlin]CAJ03706.1 hypothetical protein LMJF_18_0710 [Leishmania major strain Friedlin]|eukprot:XP_001682477.1 hypothetical protein LMJF_18_0710 [Leishmania major strain Friedlin]